jgi:alkylation response protein AidB-like acyl-CoA dehydrogenase
MDFLLSDEQSQIVDTLQTFLNSQAPVARFRPPACQIGNDDQRLCVELGTLGYLGISIGEAQGGIGLSALEEMLAYREFGRHLMSPAVLALTLAARMAARKNSDLLDGLLRGRTRVAIANPLGAVHLGAECQGDVHLIEGRDAEWVMICGSGGAALLSRNAFSDVVDVPATDHLLTLQRARLVRARPQLWVDAADDPVHRRAQLLLAAYAVGMSEATRDMAVEYAKNRQQFGKAIGSFQAIKHICADMAIRSEAALCQAIFAALVQSAAAGGEDFHGTAAKLVAVDAALKNAGQNIQVHGAIGFTAEADAHVYLKRAHVVEQLWGDTRQLRERMLAANFPD